MSASLILFYPKMMGLLRTPTILLLLLTLPRVIALFIYPDGSSCWECDYKDSSCWSSSQAVNFGCNTASGACGGSKVPDGYVIESGLKERYRSCYSANGCIHFCTISSQAGINMVQKCCFKEGSQYIRDFYFNEPKTLGGLKPLGSPTATGPTVITLTTRITITTSEAPPKATQGKGVGISCSLVESASAAYKSALSSASTTLLSYYSQALHLACIRSSPRCGVPECSQVEATLKTMPGGCKEGGDEHLGSDFEEEVFGELIGGSGFRDIEGRKAKTNAAIEDLVGRVRARDVGSPFLNLILGIIAAGDGTGTDTKALVGGYYGTVQVFGDLQPLFDKYIQTKLRGLSGGSLPSLQQAIDNIARSHSQLLKCGIGPSFASQAAPSEKSNTANTSVKTNGTLPVAAAAAASLFVPLVAAQLRNDRIIKAVMPTDTRNNTDISALSKLLNAQLPVSPALKFDTRNWIYTSPAHSNPSNAEPNSESFSLLEQALTKQELSDEAGTDFEITTELHAIMDLTISSRTNKQLSDFMAIMAMFFPTSSGTQAYKPTYITAAGKVYPIIGPVGVIFPAVSELIPGYRASPNITSQSTTSNPDTNGFHAGSGGALTPVPPTNSDISAVLYSSATLRMRIDPVHYTDANPKITNPGDHLYILDLVSGKEIPSKYSVQNRGGKGRDGQAMEFGVLEAKIEYGKGVWAGGWGGGGAFAVAVKGWVEAESGAGGWRGRSVEVLGWVGITMILTSAVLVVM